ncbi:hypothetical protein [Pseudovibrio sp. POLY-S9]|uniref:hypothetical protein n=1 Tax=Pseudovibrio sp. POLY-S9 TaxID=1576596 RepID=UPI00070A5F6C|nr:hypothetical protein [Pseudovibrio sp. POLY-S9]
MFRTIFKLFERIPEFVKFKLTAAMACSVLGFLLGGETGVAFGGGSAMAGSSFFAILGFCIGPFVDRRYTNPIVQVVWDLPQRILKSNQSN